MGQPAVLIIHYLPTKSTEDHTFHENSLSERSLKHYPKWQKKEKSNFNYMANISPGENIYQHRVFIKSQQLAIIESLEQL